jgi:AraC-like DNA-binding protein
LNKNRRNRSATQTRRVARHSRKRGARLPTGVGGPARLAFAQAKAAGIDPKPLLKKSGLTLQQVKDPQIRVSIRDQIRFLDLVADALKDEFLGFHLARLHELREIGLLYYAMASSDTLFDALGRASRYSSIVNEGISQTCINGSKVGLSLHYVGVRRHQDRHQIEFRMTSILRTCRQLTGLHLVPDRVRFAHRRQRPSGEFIKFFGGHVEFGAGVDEITFAKRVRDLRVVNADPYLSKLLIAYCEEALSKRSNGRGSFRLAVENSIVPLLPHGKPRAIEIARRLGVSERTFARQLASEGLTFSKVLERLRLDLANRYLEDKDLSISQIAWLLGYQEVSAFSHAFKRWTAKTPRAAAHRP